MSTQQPTVRLASYVAIERGVDTVLTAPVWLSGAVLAAVSAVARVYTDSNELVDTYTATVPGGIATITVLAADTATRSPASGWRVEWDITTASSVIRAHTTAVLCRRLLYPVVTDVDLYRMQPQLDPAALMPITRNVNFQQYIDESWQQIEDRLLQSGRRPWLVMDPGAFRTVHLHLALALVFESLMTSEGSVNSEKARMYRGQFEAAWSKLNFAYDLDDDGQEDPNKQAATSGVWLCRPPPYSRWYR